MLLFMYEAGEDSDLKFEAYLFYYNIYLFICVCVCVWIDMSQHTCEGHMTAYKSGYPPSTVWVSRLRFSSACQQAPLPSEPSCQSHFLFLKQLCPVAEAGFKRSVFLPQPPKCRVYRHIPPCLSEDLFVKLEVFQVCFAELFSEKACLNGQEPAS